MYVCASVRGVCAVIDQTYKATKKIGVCGLFFFFAKATAQPRSRNAVPGTGMHTALNSRDRILPGTSIINSRAPSSRLCASSHGACV